MRYAYLVTEGPHDVELIGRLLKPHAFRRIQSLKKLDPFWSRLVPRTFPHNDDLLSRVPVPVFFASENCSVAVHAAEGLSRLALAAHSALANLSVDLLDAVGVLLDSDDEEAPMERHQKLRSKLEGTVPLPEHPGMVSSSIPRTGVFILPDNVGLGTLEDLLLECAEHAYPSLLQRARTLVGGIEESAPELLQEDLKDLRKPAGRKKATFAAMTAVLKPGKAAQVSIQDNRWLADATLELPRIAALRAFLDNLLGLSVSP